MVLKMLTEELSKQMEAHLMRIEKEREAVSVPAVQTFDYIPWEDCLSDGMLAVLFNAGVTG